MARLAVLIGRTASGKLDVVDVAEGEAISDLLALRHKIRDAGGKWQKGKSEVSLAELHVLSTHTAGGELKSRLKF